MLSSATKEKKGKGKTWGQVYIKYIVSASDNKTLLRSCLKGLNYEALLFLFFLVWDKKWKFPEKEKLWEGRKALSLKPDSLKSSPIGSSSYNRNWITTIKNLKGDYSKWPKDFKVQEILPSVLEYHECVLFFFPPQLPKLSTNGIPPKYFGLLPESTSI